MCNLVKALGVRVGDEPAPESVGVKALDAVLGEALQEGVFLEHRRAGPARRGALTGGSHEIIFLSFRFRSLRLSTHTWRDLDTSQKNRQSDIPTYHSGEKKTEYKVSQL